MEDLTLIYLLDVYVYLTYLNFINDRFIRVVTKMK